MANIFDSLKNKAFDLTTKVMGYDATWTNSQTLEEFAARVHYKGPTIPEELASVDYMPVEPMIEFKAGDFPGLKELIDAGEVETIAIDTIGSFYGREVLKTFDGDTIIVTLRSVGEVEI